MQLTIDYIAAFGTADFSVRKIAAAIGTSHRVLSYHFGNKEEFLKKVMNALEKKHAEDLIFFEMKDNFDPDNALLRTWDYFTQTDILRYTQAYLELLVWRMRENPGQAAQHSGLGESWRAPLLELSERSGVPQEQAEVDAHIALAMLRGLLLEFIATGERDAPRAALVEFIRGWKRARQRQDARRNCETDA